MRVNPLLSLRDIGMETKGNTTDGAMTGPDLVPLASLLGSHFTMSAKVVSVVGSPFTPMNIEGAGASSLGVLMSIPLF